MNEAERFELELETMAHGGSALGFHQGRPVFVPYTIPGERIMAQLVEREKRIDRAVGLTLLEASADRVFPRCKHFGPGKCGRCQWQHIDYAAQLLLKQDVLADQLARLGGFEDADVRAVIGSPEQWNYNHHMTLYAAEDGTLGFPSASGAGLQAIEECHILHPDLLALYHAIDMELPGLRQMRLQIGTDGSHMVMLTIAGDEAPELEADLPTSVNLLLEDGEPVNLIGESHTRFLVRERMFRVTAGSNFRSNVSQLDHLIEVVLDALALNGKHAVLDLYAGVGLFSAFIAPHADLVTMVDSFPPAVTDAETNLAELDNVDVVEGSVEEMLDELDEGAYDAAVLDPNDGLSLDVIDLLGEVRIPRLVYVSSDPATLARDGKRLAAKGYRLGTVQPIDLNPQTYLIDSVAIFTLE